MSSLTENPATLGSYRIGLAFCILDTIAYFCSVTA